MPRRTTADPASLEGIAEALTRAISRLGDAECPTCKQRTLDVEVTLRSGISIFCFGIDAEADEGQCPFDFAYLINELPRETILRAVKAVPADP